MKKLCALLLLFCAPVWVSAQNVGVSITSISRAADEQFPVVRSGDAKVTEKINTFLQVNNLGHVPNAPENPFRVFRLPNGTRTNSFYGFNQFKTPENILSLEIRAEFCTTSCDPYSIYENFDLRNGNKIILSQIFTTKGIQEVQKTVDKNINKLVNSFVLDAKDSLRSSTLTKEERRDLEAQLEMYETCRLSSNFFNPKFYFNDHKLYLLPPKCSSRARKELDALSDYRFAYHIKEIRPYLSIYGLSLFSGNKITGKSGSIQGKLFKGTIGKSRITAVFDKHSPSNSFSGTYWYDDKKLPRQWTSIGKFEQRKLHLEEVSSNGDQAATVDAQYGKEGIFGFWTKTSNGNKPLRLQLIEY